MFEQIMAIGVLALLYFGLLVPVTGLASASHYVKSYRQAFIIGMLLQIAVISALAIVIYMFFIILWAMKTLGVIV